MNTYCENPIMKMHKTVSVIDELPKDSDFIDISKSVQSNYYCVFSKIPSLIYHIQAFSLPSTTTRKITIPRPMTTDYYAAGHTADYDELSVTFIADENYKTYFECLKWLRSNERKSQFNDTVAAMSLMILNNAKEPIIRIDFKDIIPTYISGLQFNIQNADVVTWDANFTTYSYNVRYLDNSYNVDITRN